MKPRTTSYPRDAQRANLRHRTGKRRQERSLLRKKHVVFSEGGLSGHDIPSLD
jgi:hypothetical protein